MRRIALAGGLAAVALAGTAAYGISAWSVHRGSAGGAEQAALTTAVDAEDGSGPAGGAGPASANGAAAGSAAAGQSGSATGDAAGGSTTATADGLDGTGRQSTGTQSTDSQDTGCRVGPWEPAVQGAPAGFTGGERAGDYLWHGPTGFHLRVTHRGDRRDVFVGFIRSDRPMAMRPVRLEGRDAAWLSADRRTLGFRFYDYGHIDGVDFVTACATSLAVGGLRVDGRPLPADRVYLGRYRQHPAQVPFTITRKPTA
jgi:hypothetical protein